MASKLKVGIVGGGISGLATAYYLTQQRSNKGLDLEITLLEKSPRLGGVIHSRKVGKFLLENGPEAFVSYKPAARDLSGELGLTGDLLGSRDHCRRTYILDQSGLQPLPDGMAFLAPVQARAFWATAPLTWRGKARSLLEPLVPRSRGDISVEKFFHRRLGREFTRHITEPLVSAIYGGSIRHLSTASALPLLYQLEQNTGSLWKGFRQRSIQNSSKPQPLFLTFRHGMGQLVEGLKNRLEGVQILTGVSKIRLNSSGKEYLLQSEGFEGKQDVLVLSTPAQVTATLLQDISQDTSDSLNQIPYTSTKIVYLAYKQSEFSHPLNGFGFVAAECEAMVLDACTWVSSKFDDRCPPGSVLLRCAFHDGRKRRARVSEEESVTMAHEEIRRILRISCSPTLHHVWDHGPVMPQPIVGHARKLERIRTKLIRFPGIFLTGAFVGGVGIPDCIETAKTVAAEIADLACNKTH